MKAFFEKIKRPLWSCLCIVAGNALLAFLVAAFIIPHDIIMGGTTGIGILLDKLWGDVLPIEPATVILVLNILLLFMGLLVLGKEFFFKTIASSIIYPVFLAGMQRIPHIEELTDNSLIAVLFAGCLLGISGGLVFRVGASTGGMDVINLALHKWFHLPVAVFLYITDFIILGAQAFFTSSNGILLGLVLLVLETVALDRAMIFGKSQIQLFVVSEKYDEIREALLTRLEAGVTMNMIRTGHAGNDWEAVMCVIPPRKLYSASELIRKIDPTAFITVTKIKEVHGRGFTLERKFKGEPYPAPATEISTEERDL
ncbi:MAG: YitT family protein [Ruminococcaceae bacterium]|nr:YitT family protein [Oscillospiraceae bacterium]